MELVEEVHQGPALTRALSRAAGALACAAVRLQLSEEAAAAAAEAPAGARGALWARGAAAGAFGDDQGPFAPAGAGGAVESGAAAWALLRSVLGRHGCADGGNGGGGGGAGGGGGGEGGPGGARGGALALAAAEGALAADRRVRLPAWLRALFQARPRPRACPQALTLNTLFPGRALCGLSEHGAFGRRRGRSPGRLRGGCRALLRAGARVQAALLPRVLRWPRWAAGQPSCMAAGAKARVNPKVGLERPHKQAGYWTEARCARWAAGRRPQLRHGGRRSGPRGAAAAVHALRVPGRRSGARACARRRLAHAGARGAARRAAQGRQGSSMPPG